MTSRWRFPAVPESVADARNALRTLGHESGAEEVVLDAIALCVSEAVTNVVVHAYRHGPVGDVWVTAWKPDGVLCILVADTGIGMRPRPDSPGAGFGLALIARLSAETSITVGDDGTGTELSMRFVLRPGAIASSGAARG